MVVSIGMDGRMLPTPKAIQSGFSLQKRFYKMKKKRKKVLSSLIRKHPVITSWREDALMQCKNGWGMVVHLWITTHIFQQCSENKMEIQSDHRACMDKRTQTLHACILITQCFTCISQKMGALVLKSTWLCCLFTWADSSFLLTCLVVSVRLVRTALSQRKYSHCFH